MQLHASVLAMVPSVFEGEKLLRYQNLPPPLSAASGITDTCYFTLYALILSRETLLAYVPFGTQQGGKAECHLTLQGFDRRSDFQVLHSCWQRPIGTMLSATQGVDSLCLSGKHRGGTTITLTGLVPPKRFSPGPGGSSKVGATLLARSYGRRKVGTPCVQVVLHLLLNLLHYERPAA